MKAALSTSLLLAVVLLGACSDDDPAEALANGDCPSAGSKQCPNDAAITQAQVDECNKERVDAKCGGKYVDLLKCAGSNTSCGSDGKSVVSATACDAQTNAAVSCKLGI